MLNTESTLGLMYNFSLIGIIYSDRNVTFSTEVGRTLVNVSFMRAEIPAAWVAGIQSTLDYW